MPRYTVKVQYQAHVTASTELEAEEKMILHLMRLWRVRAIAEDPGTVEFTLHGSVSARVRTMTEHTELFAAWFDITLLSELARYMEAIGAPFMNVHRPHLYAALGSPNNCNSSDTLLEVIWELMEEFTSGTSAGRLAIKRSLVGGWANQ